MAQLQQMDTGLEIIPVDPPARDRAAPRYGHP